MKSMNKVQLIGYLGKDPDIKACVNGATLAVLHLATNTYYPGKEGVPVKTTQWHTIQLWGKQKIEALCQYLIKGSHILVEGQLTYATFVDRSGQTRHFTSIEARNLVDLDR